MNNRRSEVLHWDGRVDNRDDLLLRLNDVLQGDTSNRQSRAPPTNGGEPTGWSN